MGYAQTGTGKTACFLLPVLNKLCKDPYGIFALILTPTRELGYQILEQVKLFSANFNVRVSLVTGGTDMVNQTTLLNDIPHIVIATPGRLAYFVDHDNCNLKSNLENLNFLILDEADRMLSDEVMKPDLVTILEAIPKER